MPEVLPPHASPEFFARPSNPRQRRYEIYCEGLPAEAVARRFDCSVATVYSVTRDFRQLEDPLAFFFQGPRRSGRPPVLPAPDVREHAIALRKVNLSLPDIKVRLDAEFGQAPSQQGIRRILAEEGFARLPRRTPAERGAGARERLAAPESVPLDPRACESSQ